MIKKWRKSPVLGKKVPSSLHKLCKSCRCRSNRNLHHTLKLGKRPCKKWLESLKRMPCKPLARPNPLWIIPSKPHTKILDCRDCHFVAAAAGCQKDIRVSSLDAAKPAKVVELARAMQVSTIIRAICASDFAPRRHTRWISAWLLRICDGVSAVGEHEPPYHIGGKRCVAVERSSPGCDCPYILHVGARHQRIPSV